MTVTATQSSQRLAFEARLSQALAPHPKAFALKHSVLIATVKKRACGKWLSELVRLATKLSVDPRWLATGEVSDAAKAAQQRARLWNIRGPGEQVLDERPYRELLASLELTTQVTLAPGMCRYCGCTEEHGCGDCHWVDSAATICSTCLTGES